MKGEIVREKPSFATPSTMYFVQKPNEDFELVVADSNGRLKDLKIEASEQKMYEVNFNSPVKSGSGDDHYNYRRYAAYESLSGFGVIHLDFTIPGSGNYSGTIATLVNNCPVPNFNVEEQIDDPSRNSSLFMQKGSRTITGYNIRKGIRHIVNINCFFNIK